MQANEQRQLPQHYSDAGVLDVHSTFLTIQGEGPFCGQRALFIRLYGCNLRCPGCDTNYTSNQKPVTPNYMVNQALRLGLKPGSLIVITGGEPLRQNIAPSIRHLLAHGYRVQIETNGVLWIEGLPVGHENFTIVCSPKTSRIHANVMAHAKAFKYVLRAGEIDAEDGLPTRALLHAAAPRVARPRPGALVYVQPMDEQDAAANARNMAAAVASTMEHGHTLQLQIHKIINME